MMRAVILSIAFCLLVSVQAVPPPANITFENGQENFQLIIRQGQGVLNVSESAAKKPSTQGLLALVSQEAPQATDMEVVSPLYTFAMGTRYQIKVGIKTYPKDAVPFTLRLLTASGEVAAAEEFISNEKWKKYTLSYTNIFEGDYKIAIGVAKSNVAWMIDDISIAGKVKKTALKQALLISQGLGKEGTKAQAPAPAKAKKARKIAEPPVESIALGAMP